MGGEQAIIQENAKCHTCDKIHVTTLVQCLGHSKSTRNYLPICSGYFVELSDCFESQQRGRPLLLGRKRDTDIRSNKFDNKKQIPS